MLRRTLLRTQFLPRAHDVLLRAQDQEDHTYGQRGVGSNTKENARLDREVDG